MYTITNINKVKIISKITSLICRDETLSRRSVDDVVAARSSSTEDRQPIIRCLFFSTCGRVINSCVKLRPIKNSLRCYPRKMSFNVALMRTLASFEEF